MVRIMVPGEGERMVDAKFIEGYLLKMQMDLEKKKIETEEMSSLSGFSWFFLTFFGQLLGFSWFFSDRKCLWFFLVNCVPPSRSKKPSLQVLL